MEVLLLLSWFVFVVAVVLLARKRGRSGFFWFIIAFLFSPLIAILFLICMKDLAEEEKARLREERLLAALSKREE